MKDRRELVGLLDAAAAARYLGISPGSLRALVDAGEIPFLNLGAGRKRPRRKFRLAALEAFAEQREKWQSFADPDRRTGISNLRSTVVDFEEALARRTGAPPKPTNDAGASRR